jgi:hypothetical protein
MWLFPIAVVLLLLGIVGGILTGGVFTIVLLPLGVIALIAAFATGGLAAIRERHRLNEGGVEPPLPHSHGAAGTGAGSAATATRPETLADARRAEQ